MRTPFGEYPEYHTSADNLDFISLEALSDSFEKCVSAVNILDNNGVYLNQNPKCEPQLGKRGVYGSMGGETDRRTDEMAMLWVLNMSDGHNTLLEIANRSGLDFAMVGKAAQALLDHGLLKKSAE